MENLNTSILSRLPLPLPPKDEQKAIVKHVFNHQSKIDLAIDRARSEIDLIREYRTRLIADVVTGKLDVRGVGLPELKKDDALEKLAVNENSETDEAEEDVMEGADT
jgi:restriction endonuclease S subunit